MKYEYLAKTLRPANITALDLGKCPTSIVQANTEQENLGPYFVGPKCFFEM